jgi:HrpA-like RNA helicase
MTSTERDPVGRRKLMEFLETLEDIDGLLAETAQDAIWYQKQHLHEMVLSTNQQQLKRLQESHQGYQDGHGLNDMIQYIRGLRQSQRTFDLLVDSLTRYFERTMDKRQSQWVEWYKRVQEVGTQSWMNAVPASGAFASTGTMADEGIQSVAKKYASLDRIQNIINANLVSEKGRMSFKDEYLDTL